MNKELVKAIKAGRPGAPVWLPDLRKQVSMSTAEFDSSVMELAKSGKYFLNKHFHPAQATSQEKAGFIPDGQGNYYITISKRSGVETVGAPEKKVGRGGPRAGAGRPAVKIKEKKIQLAGVRISPWLMDWLREQGNMGSKVEAALIAQYGLTPPEE